jgi:3-oxoacyl-[acyl-carrier protein] reductase
MQAELFGGRTAIVTGGARGIGLACAAKITTGGGRVALWDRDIDRAKQSAATLQGAIAVPVDVTSEDSVAKALAATEDQLASPDILVASAGITGPNTTVVSYPVDAWKQVIDINLTGVFLCNRAVAGGMATREAKLKQEPLQVQAVLRATLEPMEFNRKEKSWMVDCI